MSVIGGRCLRLHPGAEKEKRLKNIKLLLKARLSTEITLMSTQGMALAATAWSNDGVGVVGGLGLSELLDNFSDSLSSIPVTLSQLLDLYTRPSRPSCLFFLRERGVLLALAETLGRSLKVLSSALSSQCGAVECCV